MLQDALEKEKRKSKRFWRDKCEQLLNYKEDLEAKDVPKAQLIMATASGRSEHIDRAIVSPHREQNDTSRARLTATTHNSLCSYSSSSEPRVQFPTSRIGKAPPIEPFTGEGVDILFEEWLPSFERTVVWNG